MLSVRFQAAEKCNLYKSFRGIEYPDAAFEGINNIPVAGAKVPGGKLLLVRCKLFIRMGVNTSERQDNSQ